jgi:epsilon-lactone hydrolase
MPKARVNVAVTAERRNRARLPLIRLLEGYLPLGLSRRLIEEGVRRVRLPAGIGREPVSADGVACEWLTSRNTQTDRALLYLHGGGFVLGVTPQHLRLVSDLVQNLSMRALVVDYRLAPEYPFPAALEDCISAYRWLRERGIPSENVVVAGDSAGGNLTIAMLMKLRDAGERMPAAAACLSPVGALPTARVRSEVPRDPLLHPRAMKLYDSSYVGGSDPQDPLISPVLGDWRGLPPVLIHAGGDEILLDDATRMAATATAAGVEMRLEIFPRMWHVWQLNLALPQARRSLDDIAGFLGSHLGRV